MSIEDSMTIDERRKYLRMMQKRYQRADRKERGRLLDEMEAIAELDRKSLVRLMGGGLERQPRQRQRGRTYGPEVDDALRVIAESMDYICPERLTPNLTWLAQQLAAHGELVASVPLLEQLEHISESTVGRILARIRQDEPRLPRKGPRQRNALLRDIPMKRIPWHEQEPGHFEVDLVHHCGLSASGEYVCSIQMVDVATAWSERVAVLGRSYLVRVMVSVGFWAACRSLCSRFILTMAVSSSTITSSASGKSRRRGFSSRVAGPTRRMATASWSRRTRRWYEPIWGMADSTRWHTPRRSTGSTISCGCTTISSNP